MSPRTFTLASRASQLAQIQTNSVVASLEALYPPSATSSPRFATAFMSSPADRDKSQALYLLGGKALWTKDLEVALKDGTVDMLVHCLKDVPTELPTAAGKEWKSLEELPAGSVVGTGSIRRVAQLRRNFPHLKFLDVRGNLDTRVAKLDAPDGPYAALILAKAGMVRVGMGDRLTADLPPPTLYYAVSQGALAIEIRSDDAEAMKLSCMSQSAEGGCSVPVGVSTHLDDAGELQLTGCVTSVDGQLHVEHTLKEKVGSAEDAERVGAKLAKILVDAGAGEILADINKDKERRIGEAEAKEAVAQA
ncbi:hypothetical protein B0H13DRAFT_2274071 [Mycena leptocephala]|nr:hypothetical protein B0H13DRAFT_2274071 [Mycena leptocephala]